MPTADACPLCPPDAAAGPLRTESAGTFFAKLLDTSDFPPRWYCGSWTEALGWLHVISDAGIFVAYFVIPVGLISVFHRRARRATGTRAERWATAVPFPALTAAFATFFVMCGIGHALEAAIFWFPAYRLAGVWKALTAGMSLAAAIMVLRASPRLLALPGAKLKAESEAAEALTRLELTVEAAGVGTWEWDRAAGSVRTDARLRSILGLPEDAAAVTAGQFFAAVHPEHREDVRAAVQGLSPGGTFAALFRLAAEGDRPRWASARGQLAPGSAGRPERFLAVAEDVTERVHLESNLRHAKKAAEASDRAKSEFLANMSHELRTPLTAILGFADLAAGRFDGGADAAPDAAGPDAEAAEYCRTIRRNGEHLLSLINEVLDLGKIEAGKMEAERVPTRVRPLVAELAATLAAEAERKGLRLQAEVTDRVPEAVLVDPTRLRQMLLNLLANGVKFTAEGEVRLRARYDAAAAEAEFVVEDTGCGIPADDLERLFDPFEQADASVTRRFGGTGLGLCIARRLAEGFGGSLTARSLVGEGTTFTLRLPAESADPPAEPPADTPPVPPAAASDGRPAPAPASAPAGGADGPLAGTTVLLAEDTPDTRRLLRFFLGKAGATVEAVPDGQAAVTAATGPSGRRFDVILMDMQMPIMDGYAAARALRADGYAGPIVALTAHAMRGDEGLCREAGCDGYAVKPIGRDRLVEVVTTATAGRSLVPAPA